MAKFDYFIVFAEMRTGSNFLETNLNAFDGLQCHGEAFNPHFIGYPNSDNILGVTQKMREDDPSRLIETIKNFSDGLGGFRFFNDHDPRVLDIALADPRCAKIVLTRNPIESYVSWKIAQATGQWKLTNVTNARSKVVPFDESEFERHVDAIQSFQVRVLNALQVTGQSAFYVAYEDLQNVDVMNGLADYLGCTSRLDRIDTTLKKQNPAPITDKVSNPTEMERALARLDRFNLTRTPNFEPRRGPMVPTFIAPAKTGLMYMPVKSGPVQAVREWLSAIDGDLPTIEKFSQKTLKHWQKSHPGFRSFTVVRHPVARAHAAFCDYILGYGEQRFGEISQSLKKMFGLPLPKEVPPEDNYSDDIHRTAFLGFLKFTKASLSAQTSVRLDPAWATQSAVVEGFAQFATPDLVIREDRIREDLAYLAYTVGRDDAPDLKRETDPHHARLEAIYDEEIEAAAADAYQRDYLNFGFQSWS